MGLTKTVYMVCTSCKDEMQRAMREIERLTALADVQRSIDRNTAYEQDIERLTRERDGLRAALERIDAHLEVRPGREEFGDLQVSGGYGNSVSFWLAHKAARELLTHSQSEPRGDQAPESPLGGGEWKLGQVEGVAWSDVHVVSQPPELPPQNLIVSADEAKQPWAFRHWSKDVLVPYPGCYCDTCRSVSRDCD